MTRITSDKRNELIRMAKSASHHAHSPYSKKQVGSAVLWNDDTITTGCNIENASYGATVCAERVAIWKKISESNQSKISMIVVYIDEPKAWPPCGMCRQVMAEFCSENTLIISTNGKSHTEEQTFSALFPGAFSKDFLNK